MVQACPVCDTLWRLYVQALDNVRELAAKHREARDKGDQNAVELLACEVNIAESALPVVRRELRRHELGRHSNRQENAKSENSKGENSRSEHSKPA